MKPIIYNVKRVRRSTNASFARFTLITLTLFMWIALSLLALSGMSASASAPNAPQDQTIASPVATSVVTSTVTSPIATPVVSATLALQPTSVPVSATVQIPGPVQTKTLPKPQQTGQPTVPGAVLTPRAGTPSRPSGSSGDFPWLPVVVVGLGALALAGFVLMRPRPTAVVAPNVAPSQGNAAVAPPVEADTDAATSTTTTTTQATQVAGPPVAFSAPVQPAPTSVTCPNCDTVNNLKENFCHACGQDLRPTRAALMAALAPPPDVVTDDMPYLETLDRVDEQLEYVLSRPRVVLGTASNSDIVIDTAFKDWQSVSPTHAEVRRGEESYLLVDRDSKNGTFVNDTPADESALADGDTIRLGDVRFIFHIPGPEDAQ